METASGTPPRFPFGPGFDISLDGPNPVLKYVHAGLVAQVEVQSLEALELLRGYFLGNNLVSGLLDIAEAALKKV